MTHNESPRGGAAGRPVTSRSRHLVRCRARYDLLRQAGYSWRDAKHDCTHAGRFRTAMEALGFRDLPPDLVDCKRGNPRRLNTPKSIKRQARYAELKALGFDPKTAGQYSQSERMFEVAKQLKEKQR